MSKILKTKLLHTQGASTSIYKTESNGDIAVGRAVQCSTSSPILHSAVQYIIVYVGKQQENLNLNLYINVFWLDTF